MPRERYTFGSIIAALGAFLLVGLMGYLDFRTGPDVAFTISYLLPILLAAAYGPPWAGMLVALVCSFALSAAEIYEGTVTTELVLAWNLFSRFLLFGTVAGLIASLRRQLNVAKHYASVDALTGLASRGHFMNRLAAEVKRASRYRRPMSLAYLDVDDFKLVNDSRGHSAGDALLRQIARALESGTRQSDLVSRVGGDEFMILMPEAGADEANVVGERIHAALGRAAKEFDAPVGFSIGVMTFDEGAPSVEEAVRSVDELMYEVKRTGKDGLLHRVAE